MTPYLVIAVVLGILAGVAPGPYTTMVMGTSLQRGFKEGVKLAFVPLATDIIPMIATVFILDALNWTALTLLGITGGTIIGMVGVRFLRHHGPPALEGDEPLQSASFSHAAGGTFLSPAPWLFWLVVAGPFMVAALEYGTATGVLYAVVLFSTNIGTASALAWAVSHSRKILSRSWRRRVLQVAGVVLVGAGVLLVWQSMEGNFQAMMDRQEMLRDAIEEQWQ
jgi:threonine/homoserine/homoserine lactone efflux protein